MEKKAFEERVTNTLLEVIAELIRKQLTVEQSEITPESIIKATELKGKIAAYEMALHHFIDTLHRYDNIDEEIEGITDYLYFLSDDDFAYDDETLYHKSFDDVLLTLIEIIPLMSH